MASGGSAPLPSGVPAPPSQDGAGALQGHEARVPVPGRLGLAHRADVLAENASLTAHKVLHSGKAATSQPPATGSYRLAFRSELDRFNGAFVEHHPQPKLLLSSHPLAEAGTLSPAPRPGSWIPDSRGNVRGLGPHRGSSAPAPTRRGTRACSVTYSGTGTRGSARGRRCSPGRGTGSSRSRCPAR